MLAHLLVKNYALIDDLRVDFQSGFTTITGETGAGKSILLGALSLVLGKRADLSALRDKTQKCTVEATFTIANYDLQTYFEEHDLDYDDHTFVRREILPSGKSRAFVNDTPVTLGVLSGLGAQLVDIHSQHQTLQLTENTFQFKVIDALAANSHLLADYAKERNIYQVLTEELDELRSSRAEATKELDYHTYQLEELRNAPLQEGILEALETEQAQLDNVEQLMQSLAEAHELLNGEMMGLLNNLSQLQQLTQKLVAFGKQYGSIQDRVQSMAIELNDIAALVEDYKDNVEPDPERLIIVNAQLSTLEALFNKHQVRSVAELLVIRDELAKKVERYENIDGEITTKAQAVAAQKGVLQKLGDALSQNRKKVIPELQKRLESKLANLGMPSASFKIAVAPANDFKTNGTDVLTFLFAANKGSDYGELKKVASGGELSRIMLTIKSILATYERLPTLMFDEIDTGVSGEVSNAMGEIMKAMGTNMQVFSITHLPQVAAKGSQQFKVYKEEHSESTTTKMRSLAVEERVKELAEMLGGKAFSASAINHAKELLAEG
ncbi:MAG: DNA repair protein RecN [Bacteroidota bacterium]